MERAGPLMEGPPPFNGKDRPFNGGPPLLMERAGPLMEGPRHLMEMASLKKVNISMAGPTVVLSRVLGRTQKNGGAKKDLHRHCEPNPPNRTRG